MGYRGKIVEQDRARELRARAWTLAEIAQELDVAKGSVSLWVRGVTFDIEARDARAAERKVAGLEHRSPWSAPRQRPPNALQRRKQAEIDRLRDEGVARIGTMTDQEFLVAGVALYAGDGSKTGGSVKFANSNPKLVAFHCSWLRRFFDIEERRLRCRLYLHQGLDLSAAINRWSSVTAIPPSQFTKPYRAVPDPSIRRSKHPFGCAHVDYSCTRTHRAVMGLIVGLVSSEALPG